MSYRLFPILMALTLATAGCELPTAGLSPGDLTIGSLLSGGEAKLFDLKAGAGDVAVSLSGSRSAFLMFNSMRGSADRLSVAINALGDRALRGYQTLGLPAPGIPGPAAAPADAPLGQAPFERRLRDWEAPLRALKPDARRYKLAQAARYQVGSAEKFWVIANFDDTSTAELPISATAAYVGEHCYIFVDDAVTDSRTADRVQQMGKAFDAQIHPTDSRLFGPPLASGVNGDPKITLLITPAVGNYGRDTTIGYFTVRDLFRPDADPSSAMLKHSNQRLMLYISSIVVSRGQASDYLGTIAHEFQHLINASQRLFRPGTPAKTEDLWLDEGLAMYAMEANGYGLAGAGGVVFNHVAAYERYASQYSLTNWSVDPDGSAYGAVYLFTTYLADRFGEGLLGELVAGSQTGVANVNARLARYNTSFEKVFDDWTAANLLDHSGFTNDPRFNYKSINLLGAYGQRKLRGMSLEAVQVPNTGALDFKPYSAQYFYVPKGAGGRYTFSLTGSGSQDFGGLVVAP